MCWGGEGSGAMKIKRSKGVESFGVDDESKDDKRVSKRNKGWCRGVNAETCEASSRGWNPHPAATDV